MSEAKIIATRLRISMDATIEIKTDKSGTFSDWIKPGAAASITWDSFPSGEQLADAAETLSEGVVNPILGELISSAADRIKEISA